MAQVNKEDIERMAQKLEQFAKGLPPQERNVLGWILARAEMAAEKEVAGYAVQNFASPTFQNQFYRSGGFRSPLPSKALTVSWSW